MKNQSFRLLICLLFLAAAGCSKSKTEDTSTSRPASSSTKKSSKLPTTATLCEKLFYFAQTTTEAHLQKYKSDSTANFRLSVKESEAILKKMFDIQSQDINEKLIKPENCSEIERFAQALGKNEKVRTATKDIKNFDPLMQFLEMSLARFVKHLDPHCLFIPQREDDSEDSVFTYTGFRFLNRADYEDREDLDGKVIKVGRKPPYLYAEQTPAYLRYDIPQYSRIYQIDKLIIANEKLDTVIRRFYQKGPAEITYSAYNEATKTYDAQKTNTFELKADKPTDTEFRIISSKPGPVIGYLKIVTFFNKGLDDDLLKTWIQYLMTFPEKLDGTIIDLRGNGGGRLDEMAKILGTIINSSDAVAANLVRRNGENLEAIAQPVVPSSTALGYGKIVVLTDFLTASASEMLVAALHDYGAALIVGETTIGKGIGQTRFQIKDPHLNAEAYITDFYMTSSAGTPWYFDGWGADIPVEEKANDGYRWHFRDEESVLPPMFTKKFDYQFDSSIPVPNPLSTEVLEELKLFRADPKNEPEICSKTTVDVEEDSCIYSWGIQLLKEWIRLEPQRS